MFIESIGKQPVSEKIELVGVEPTGFTVFHRTGRGLTPTQISERIANIIKQGFKPDRGDMYGVGMYSTLNLKSQLNNYMENSYGDGVIQYFVPKKGFIIFDYTIARKIYPSDFTLAQQLLVNGVYKNASEIPYGLQALSRDLLDTLKNPLVSADRAYRIWRGCYDSSSARNVADVWESLTPAVTNKEAKSLYAAAKAESKKQMSRIPGIQGIVYTGENDGNVVLVYRPTPTVIQPRKWCVLIPGNKPSNIDNNTLQFAIEWQKVGTSQPATVKTLMGTLVDKGVITPVKTFERITNDSSYTAEDLIKMEPWMKHSGSKFHKIYLQTNKNKKNAVVAGIFRSGILTVHHFGVKPPEVPEPTDITSCEYRKSIFLGGIFKGAEFNEALFAGGRFESGVFNGYWLGGTWVYSSNAVWGKKAKIVDVSEAKLKFNNKFLKSEKWESYILYQGQTYPLDRPVPEWVEAFNKGTLKIPGSAVGSAETDESITANLAKAVKVSPAPTINIAKKGLFKSTKDAVDLFKKHFPWIFQNNIKFQSSAPAVITFDDGKKTLSLESGVAVSGKLSFNYYGKNAVVMGGVVSGDNLFEGFLDGGNYTEGTFNGVWRRGSLYIEKIKIGTNVSFTAPDNDNKNGVSFLVKGSRWEAFRAAWLQAYNNDLHKFLTSFKSNADKTRKVVQDYFQKLINTTDDIDLDSTLDYSDNDTDD